LIQQEIIYKVEVKIQHSLITDQLGSVNMYFVLTSA